MDGICKALEQWFLNFFNRNGGDNTASDAMSINVCTANLPKLIEYEIDKIKTMEAEKYGMVFMVKEFYEISLKTILLAVCTLSLNNDEDDFCKTLLAKPLSFGDWVNDICDIISKSNIICGDMELLKFIKDFRKFYEKKKIVSWRNEEIGHGLAKLPDNGGFFTDVEIQVNALIDYFNQNPIPQCILNLDYDKLYPFIGREANGHMIIFDSAKNSNSFFYLDLNSGERISIENDILSEKYRKFNSQLSVVKTATVRNGDYLLGSESDAINSFYLGNENYQKPDYMKNWLQECLNSFDRGVFLLQGARETGKSSFVLACDEINQHDRQKIKLVSGQKTVSVRCFYCNRIDILNKNDFFNALMTSLRYLNNEDEINFVENAVIDQDLPLPDILDHYREIYRRCTGKEKLLFIIDGIDELNKSGWDILGTIPEKEAIPKDVYILLTCRNEDLEILPVVRDFIKLYEFTDQVNFDIKMENHQLMTGILGKLTKKDPPTCEKIADEFDNRLSVVSLLANLPMEVIDNIINGQGEDKFKYLVLAYIMKLEMCYGKAIFNEFIRFLMCICDAKEPLTHREITGIVFDSEPRLRDICFLKDAGPILREWHTYHGNAYQIARDEYRSIIGEEYTDAGKEVFGKWADRISAAVSDKDSKLSVEETDALLYMSAYYAEMHILYPDVVIPKDDELVSFFNDMYTLCKIGSVSGQFHQEKRRIRTLHLVEKSLIQIMTDEKDQTYENLRLLLSCSVDAINLSVSLLYMKEAEDLIDEVYEFVSDKERLFIQNGWEGIRELAQFYCACMVRYCEEYDTDRMEVYYNAAVRVLQQEQDYETNTECFEMLGKLMQDYLGAIRNEDPVKAEKMIPNVYAFVNNGRDSFEKANGFLTIALAYKSLRDFEKSKEILDEAKAVMDRVLKERQISFMDMQDPRELMIYMQVQLRLAQYTNEKCKDDMMGVSLDEMDDAIQMLDLFINAVIRVSLEGYGLFDTLRVEMMVTSALLRSTAAVKINNMAINAKYREKLPSDAHKRYEQYKDDAFCAVTKIKEAYGNLDRGGVAYNITDAMFNLMNCACIYGGFGEFDTAIEMISDILKRYTPRNKQEQMVYKMVRRKKQEILMLKEKVIVRNGVTE